MGKHGVNNKAIDFRDDNPLGLSFSDSQGFSVLVLRNQLDGRLTTLKIRTNEMSFFYNMNVCMKPYAKECNGNASSLDSYLALACQSEPCELYNICTNDGNCSCPSVLLPSCKLCFISPCGDDKLENSIEFLKDDDGLSYFILDFIPPYSNTDLARCQTYCRGNRSCLAMIFHTSSRNCFLLDTVGSSHKFNDIDYGYVSYIKVVSSYGSGIRNKNIIHISNYEKEP
ncbi:hypothetical protein KIW84_036010 [Lathyrus oleraceus]|uniref:Apple domain-containing protein n=1 Tax=Pisum sativum TaxID=3888 RepID=A0A9D4Y3R1_PEA|nr:hypothetical protein KIW84_036010 [Pisum sativum]